MRFRGGAPTVEPAPALPPPPPPPLPPALSPLEAQLGELLTLRAASDLDPFRIPAVVSARRLIADTVAQLPLVAVRDGQPREHQPSILERPDPAEPRWLTLHRLVNSLTRHGLAWLVITARDGNGLPIAVRVLEAGAVAPTWDRWGRLATAVLESDRAPLDTADVIAVPYNVERSAAGGLEASSPIQDALPVLEGFAALYAMAGSYWEAGYPSLAITTKARLSDAQAEALKARVLASWHRRHEPAVIDADGQLSAVGASATEAQLVEALSVVVAEVARVFQIPASLLNAPAGSSLTYATTESEFRRWLTTGLQPVLMRIEDAFSSLLPRGDIARCDTFELFRSDLATRSDAYETILGGAPWMTVSEVRKLEKLPPLEVAPALSVGRPADDAPAPAVNA